MSDERTAMRIRVTGRVQGVSFRAWTQTEAQRLGLCGWVRNEPDGAVSALIAGPSPAVSAMIARLWDGPPPASVSNVISEKVDPESWPEDFRILRSSLF